MLLNVLGSGAYLVAAFLALSAAWHDRALPWRRNWWLVAAIFAGLALWRASGAEALLHEAMRAAANAENAYDDRRMVQGPVFLLLVIAAGWGAARAYRGMAALPRDVQAANAASAALLAYSLIRAMSYHPVDALIYAGIGPLHVNHLLDMGLTAIAGIAALLAWRRMPGAPRRKRRNGY